MNTIKTYGQARSYLNSFIPKEKKYKFPGEIGLSRTKFLLQLLGNPQNKLQVVHIAGTSGKSSTAYLISTTLKSQGKKTGLFLSPHLLDLRERFEINNELLSKEKVSHYTSQIIPSIEIVKKSQLGPPTYFEITVALAYYIFQKETVDYAVIETGLGGLLDSTNSVNNPSKVAVITNIGHDHTAVLGSTLPKIALQKAGIIGPHNHALTISQNPAVLEVFSKKAKQENASLDIIDKKSYTNISLDTSGTVFDFAWKEFHFKGLKLGLMGSFQVRNCSLALSTVLYLSSRDHFAFDENKTRVALEKANFPGRMQTIKIKNQSIIFDGAHNPQKMSELIKSLKEYFPNKKITFLIGFKDDKDCRDILKKITPLAQKIIITPFFNQPKSQGFSISSMGTARIAQTLKVLKFTDFQTINSSERGLDMLLNEPPGVKVVTGSLYLLSEILIHL